jgi:hypothetical protein
MENPHGVSEGLNFEGELSTIPVVKNDGRE